MHHRIIYPVTILLITFNLFGIEDAKIYRAGISVALLFSFIELGYKVAHIDILGTLYLALPFASAGFSWLVPTAVVLTLVSALNYSKRGTQKY